MVACGATWPSARADAATSERDVTETLLVRTMQSSSSFLGYQKCVFDRCLLPISALPATIFSRARFFLGRLLTYLLGFEAHAGAGSVEI
jgi:hypothetical protein